MTRRESLLALGAAAVAGFGGSIVTGQAHTGHATTKPSHHDAFEHCVAVCLRCLTECEAGAVYCRDRLTSGNRAYATCAALCADCSEVCSACARLMSRQSQLTATMARACAEACETCAAACEALASDARMAALSKTCRECAASCREMVKALAG